MTDADFRDLVDRAQAAYDALNPSQKLRHDYMQRRSFARGMAPWKADFSTYCAAVDRLMPDEKDLTDTEIGLALIGKLAPTSEEGAA